MCSPVTCLQISKHCQELGDVDDFVLVNWSLTASLNHYQFLSLLFQGKLLSDLVHSDSMSEIMKSPVLGRETIWTQSENEQDTPQVTLRKKVSVQSGGELNGYSHLLKHHTQARQHCRNKLRQLIHKRILWICAYQEDVKGDLGFCQIVLWRKMLSFGCGRVSARGVLSSGRTEFHLYPGFCRRWENRENLSPVCTEGSMGLVSD